MNYLLHRQKFPNSVVSIPDGLQELMGDISREVLRAQPPSDEIYHFIANYLEALIETRDKIQITKTTLCDIINRATDIADQLQMDGFTLDKAREAVSVMKKSFSKLFEEKRKCHFNDLHLRESKEAEVIAELVKKCQLTMAQVGQMKPIVREAFKNFVDEYLKALRGITLNMDDIKPIAEFTFEKYFKDMTADVKGLTEAATIIQSAFRGYVARKSLRKSVLTKMPGNTDLKSANMKKIHLVLRDLSAKEYSKADKAARTIQKAYRKSFKGSGHNVQSSFSCEVLKEVVLGETIRYDDYIYNEEDVPDAMDILNKGYKDYKLRLATRQDVGEIYNEQFGRSDQLIEHAVVVLQKAFRNFLERRRLQTEEKNKSPSEIASKIFLIESEFHKLAQDIDSE